MSLPWVWGSLFPVWGKRSSWWHGPDLVGANLHTLMGVRFPPVTLEDFLLNRVDRLEDVVIDTRWRGLV